MSYGDRLATLGLPQAAVGRLVQFRQDLLRFGRVQNLTSRPGGETLVDALILESAMVAWQLPWRGPVLDLGSGAGFPGIPYSSIFPDIEVALLDRRRGRCDFLRRECRALPLPAATVLEGDARELSGRGDLRGHFGTVFLKAVAEPGVALGLAAPFLREDGRCALFRGADWVPPELPGWGHAGPRVAGPGPGPGPEAVVHIFSRV